MESPKLSSTLYRWLLGFTLVLLLLALFGWQHLIPLRAEEPRRALISLEMLLTGDYLVPHINGWVYYNKPPLFNWITVFFFKIFGSSDAWVARLPSLVGFVGLAITHYFFSKKYLGEKVALISALACLTGVDMLLYATVNSGEIDLLYAFVVYLQAIAIFHYQQKGQFWRMFLITYVLTFIGFMLKGLPSLAFQAMTILAWLVLNKQWKKLFHPAHFVGILLLAALGVSYFYPFSLRENWMGVIARQFLEASIRTGLESHWYDTLVQTVLNPFRFLLLLFPWTFLLVPYIRFRSFRTAFLKGIKENPFLTFSVVFLVANVWLYWFTADFKARYQYMFFPFFLSLLFYPKGLSARWVSAPIIMILGALPFFALPFISYFDSVSFLWPKILVLVLAFFGIAYVYKYKSRSLIVVVLFMAVFRIGFNEIYLRAVSNDPNANKYVDHAHKILEIANNRPVYLYAEPYHLVNDLAVGPINFGTVELDVSTLIPYQLPYTITNESGMVMQFKNRMDDPGMYLADKSLIDTSRYEILYRMRDEWQKRDYVLIEP